MFILPAENRIEKSEQGMLKCAPALASTTFQCQKIEIQWCSESYKTIDQTRENATQVLEENVQINQ